MKGKKIFAGFAAALCAAAAFGFAACSNTAEKAKNLVSEEVTREEWEAAFSLELFTNVKLESNSVTKRSSGDVSGNANFTSSLIISSECVITEGLEYMKLINKFDNSSGTQASETEYYYAYTDDGIKYYTYEHWNNGWAEITAERAMPLPSEMIAGYCSYKDEYEEFEYSAEQKGYVDKSTGTVVLKFKDKKFVAYYQQRTVSGSVSEDTLYVTYGGQSLKLPAIS